MLRSHLCNDSVNSDFDQTMLWYSKITDVSETKFHDTVNCLKTNSRTGVLSVFTKQNTLKSKTKKLSSETIQKIMKYIFMPDKIRSLLSELLQYALVTKYFSSGLLTKPDANIDNQLNAGICIKRTVVNKPYLHPITQFDQNLNSNENDDVLRYANAGTFNFNASHHGDYVAIVSHPCLLVGIDIVDIRTTSKDPTQTAFDYIKMFDSQITNYELNNIFSIEKWTHVHQNNPKLVESLCYSMFYINWSLKEAFIKAVGDGLHYDLLRIQFEIKPNETMLEILCGNKSSNNDACNNDGTKSVPKGNATITIDGILRSDWSFEFFFLDGVHNHMLAADANASAVSDKNNLFKHICAIAKGPLCNACDNYAAVAWKHLGRSDMYCIHCMEQYMSYYPKKTESDNSVGALTTVELSCILDKNFDEKTESSLFEKLLQMPINHDTIEYKSVDELMSIINELY